MERLKRLFTVDSVSGAALLIAFFTLLSQITAFFRDRVLVGTFGAGEILDIYYAAFKVPDLIYAIVSAFFSAVIIIPLLNKAGEENGWTQIQKVFSNFLNFLLLLLIPVSLLAYFFSPEIVRIYLPGFSVESQNSVTALVRIMLLQPIFLGLSGLISCLAQAQRRFLAFSLAPVMYNFGIIFGVVFFYKSFGIKGLAWGVVLGAILHLLTQSVMLLKDWGQGKFSYSLDLNFREIFQLLKSSNFRALGIFLQQIKYFALTFFASLFGIGVLSVFQISFNLFSVFVTLLAVSFATASFPVLSKLYAEKNHRALAEEILSSIKYLLLLTLPISFYVILMRAQLVRIILGGAGLSWEATRLIAFSFALMSSLLLVQALSYFLNRVAYASHDVQSPFFSQLFGTLVMIFFLWLAAAWGEEKILSQDLFPKISNLLRIDLADFSSVKALILPLAVCLETLISTFFLVYFLRRKNTFPFLALKSLQKTLIDSLLASGLLFLSVYLFLRLFEPLLQIQIGEYTTLPGLILQTSLTSVFGFLVWYLVLKYRKNEEIQSLEVNLKNKIWQKKIELPVNLSDIRPE